MKSTFSCASASMPAQWLTLQSWQDTKAKFSAAMSASTAGAVLKRPTRDTPLPAVNW
jgi:hypothetical protein